MNIYERIKGMADIKNVKIAEIESVLGLGNGTISKWKTSIPKSTVLYQVSNFLEVPIEYFLVEENALPCFAPFTFNKTEIDLIEKFRCLTDQEKQEIIDYVNFKYTRAISEGNLSTSGSGKKDDKNHSEAG